FFFFSSRRRHTRWPRDWSSDVCSSDLVRADPIFVPTCPQLDVVQAGLRVALVVVEADERKRADIDLRAAAVGLLNRQDQRLHGLDRKSTRLNSSHVAISYAVCCLKKKT